MGLGIGGGFTGSGAGGQFSIGISTLDGYVNQNSCSIGESLGNKFMIRSDAVPVPIHIKLNERVIAQALDDVFWTEEERNTVRVRQKRMNLKKALADYAENKRAQIASGMLMDLITIEDITGLSVGGKYVDIVVEAYEGKDSGEYVLISFLLTHQRIS